jgi:hypothetical protein
MKMPVPLNLILFAIAVALYLAIATVLVRKYLRTRDVGFAWLGVAVVVWPLLSSLLGYGQRLFVHRFGSGPFYTVGDLVMIITYVQQIVRLALLFTAVFYLSKTQGQTDMRVA